MTHHLRNITIAGNRKGDNFDEHHHPSDRCGRTDCRMVALLMRANSARSPQVCIRIREPT
jgi:hypothetical protein